MKAVQFARMARRLGTLCILGIPIGPAISDEPRPVTEAAVMELVGPHFMSVNSAKTMNTNGQRSFAVIRPANPSDNSPMRMLRGTQTYIATADAELPVVQNSEAQFIQRVAHIGEAYEPDVGPIQVNPLVTPQPTNSIAQTGGSVRQKKASVQPKAVHPVQQTAAEEESLEFSLSEDSLDALLDTDEVAGIEDGAMEIAIELDSGAVNDALLLKNRQSELPPTLIRPGAKTFMVVASGANSSIKIPRLPLVNDVIAAAALKQQANAEIAEVEQIAVVADPVDAAVDPKAADSKRTKVVKRAAKPEPTLKRSSAAQEMVFDPIQNPYLELLDEGAKRKKPVVFHPSEQELFQHLGQQLKSIRLRHGDTHRVFHEGATEVVLERPELCDAIIVNGEILLVPKQSGVTRMALLSPTVTANCPWIELTIESDGPVLADRITAVQLQQLVSSRFPRAKVYIEALEESISVRGETENEDQAKQIVGLVRQTCLCPVVDQLVIRIR